MAWTSLQDDGGSKEDLPDLNAGQTHRLKLMEAVSKTPNVANIDPSQQRHGERHKNTKQRKASDRYFGSASRIFNANLLDRTPFPKGSDGPIVKLPKSVTQKDQPAGKQQVRNPPPILTDKKSKVKKLQIQKTRSKGANISKTIKAP